MNDNDGGGGGVSEIKMELEYKTRKPQSLACTHSLDCLTTTTERS